MANVSWRSVASDNGLIWFSREMHGMQSRFRVMRLPNGLWQTAYWVGSDYKAFSPKANGQCFFPSAEAAKAAF
jgi:hypothetical protein